MEGKTITIEQSRYEELIKLESRVEAITDYIAHGSFVSVENVLRMLGTDKAIKYAEKLQAKDEAERAAHRKKMGEEMAEEE